MQGRGHPGGDCGALADETGGVGDIAVGFS
jgi:hypothetical protein